MFWKIFSFEIQSRIRRPVIYLYFAAVLVFTIGSFATGSLPLGEKEHINAPFLIAMWCAGMTMMMMLISSSIMGVALYRDIEYNTKDYYLTYPITKAGYFWGRFLGSFACMLFIASSILFGIYLGTKIGPLMGWRDAKEYGPNNLIYYLHPFFTIALPNIFFTSSIFFGLVAVTRNVKVIYSGGILLFLGYFLSVYFLNNTNNATVINLADPFGLNGIRYASGAANSIEKNNSLFPVSRVFLWNRILWPGIGVIVLLGTYARFSFEKFFSGRRDKSAIDEGGLKVKRTFSRNASANFTAPYNRKTLWSLTRIELLNIIRDNYFWIILSAGMAFLAFVFWLGNREYGVSYYPRTVMLFSIFLDVFPFFIFFIIIFYTGETLHRDRSTRYSFINDSLPPPNWVLNGSKLISLLILGVGLAFIPVILGLIVQTLKGFHDYNIPVYFLYLFVVILPGLLAMVLFSYVVHVVINNKFVAHGVGVTFWVVVFFLRVTGVFNYNLLLYSYTPWYGISDMDGIGHMLMPVIWFNIYWLLFGGLLIIVAALFYFRGVSSSFKERLQLARERFDRRTKSFTAVLLIAFLTIGGWIYYNVSYLNTFLINYEQTDRAILYEKSLKKYQHLPLPKITRARMAVDIYPDNQQEFVHALITVVNKNSKPIEQLLLDADGITDYSIRIDGQPVKFSSPLLYPRGFFNLFKPKYDTAEFRLYQLSKPIGVGDSVVFEINSAIYYHGFRNGLYAGNLLHNGTFFNGGLPGLGYDDDDELGSPYERKKAGLPPKEDEEIAQDDPIGMNTLKAGNSSDLLSLDLTVSTSGDQTVVAPGELQRKWQEKGRNYFHFVQNSPGLYQPVGIVSARFTDSTTTADLDHPVSIHIYHHPAHNANIGRFVEAYRDGLKYFSSVYGKFPFNEIRLAETSGYGPHDASMTSFDTHAEYYGWNADFTDPNEFDYCYFYTVKQLAQQWWRFEVAPNNTIGSLVIPEGLSTYSALVMAEKKYGVGSIKSIIQDQLWFYLFVRSRQENKEHPLIKADKWFEYQGKASVALYGLRDLIGEDSINAALREFKEAYSFKTNGPFAGANDLYRYLDKHVPDSLKYYLIDTWQKITLYDNKVVDVKATPTGKPNEYRVTMTVDIAKAWIDDKGNDIPVTTMNDYIYIGIFAENNKDTKGRFQANPLYLKKQKLTIGKHTFSTVVSGKPVSVGIDPYAILIDRQPNDNMKNIEE